jgi:hypothetical protein
MATALISVDLGQWRRAQRSIGSGGLEARRPRPHGGFRLLARLQKMLALLAAIMLVIAGSPALAATQGCDPCPPDCAMMAPTAEIQPAGPDAAPKQGPASEAPCKQTVLCQSAFAAAPLLTAGLAILSTAEAEHSGLSILPAPSRPPDPALRPPILL